MQRGFLEDYYVVKVPRFKKFPSLSFYQQKGVRAAYIGSAQICNDDNAVFFTKVRRRKFYKAMMVQITEYFKKVLHNEGYGVNKYMLSLAHFVSTVERLVDNDNAWTFKSSAMERKEWVQHLQRYKEKVEAMYNASDVSEKRVQPMGKVRIKIPRRSNVPPKKKKHVEKTLQPMQEGRSIVQQEDEQEVQTVAQMMFSSGFLNMPVTEKHEQYALTLYLMSSEWDSKKKAYERQARNDYLKSDDYDEWKKSQHSNYREKAKVAYERETKRLVMEQVQRKTQETVHLFMEKHNDVLKVQAVEKLMKDPEIIKAAKVAAFTMMPVIKQEKRDAPMSVPGARPAKRSRTILNCLSDDDEYEYVEEEEEYDSEVVIPIISEDDLPEVFIHVPEVLI